MNAKTRSRPARTQEQRSADTRQRLLDATINLLIEIGYARTSTWAVCARAGVSRGALLHHFPTRVSLMVAAVDHLARVPLDILDETLKETPPAKQTDLFLSWLWTSATGDLFAVGLELLTAARTEQALRAVIRDGGDLLQQRLEETIARIVETQAQPLNGPLHTALLASIPMVRGIGLDLSIGGDHTKHRDQYERWRRAVAQLAP